MEAQILAEYLLNRSIPSDWSREIQERYDDAVLKLNLKLSKREKMLLKYSRRFPFFLWVVDLGCSNRRALKKHILLVLAILETHADFHPWFLSRQQGVFDFLKICVRGSVNVISFLPCRILAFLLLLGAREVNG
ncbi:MAG: hypothetical protein AB7F43_00695 [Bacteriovoracia bacterium]